MKATLRITNDAQERISRYGPVPDNPFRKLRESNGFSLEFLSKSSYIDQAALLRAEQGLYANPLPSLVDYWLKRNQNFVDLTNAYADYQTLQRKRHYQFFGPSLATDPDSPTHPFRQLRNNRPHLLTNEPLPVGPVDTSKALCLPLDTLQFFEKKYKTQQSVPKALKAILQEIGYTHDQVQSFEATYKEWRANQIKAKVRFS